MGRLQSILLFVLGSAIVACSDFQERDLIKRQLSGRLIKLRDITHGKFYLYIKSNETSDTLRYAQTPD
jgi:hypothetical protein